MPGATPAAGPLYGGVELGGTKVICVVGSGQGDVIEADRQPTTGPEQTLGWAVARLQAYERLHGPLVAIGIASFGPIDLRGESGGRILRTPKPGWEGADVVGPFREAFAVPIGVASDVEGAALAEGATGAARGARSFIYLTVGTGIGAGVVLDGRLARGLLHAETGHVPVPRQPGDDYGGHCPFHGDCLEGMACGPALAARWGRPADKLDGDRRDRAMDLEAAYLASGLRAMVYAFAPERIVIGGGLGLASGLLPRVRRRLAVELAGYPGLAEFDRPDFVVAAGLGGLAGPAGALLLARNAAGRDGKPPRGSVTADSATS